MMDMNHFIYFLVVSILLTLAPGPDILFVIAQSISNGRKAGIATGVGLCTGVIVHTSAAAIGITALLYNSVTLFQVVKFGGAAYLLYLAWQAWREGTIVSSAGRVPRQSLGSLFRRGIFMNVLNPKVSLFFLAFLPQFVTPGTDNPAVQMIILGLVFMIQALLIFTLVAIGSGWIGGRMMRSSKAAKYINKGKAFLYAGIGLRLVFVDKNL